MRLDTLIFFSQTEQRGFQIGSNTKAGDPQFLSGFVKKSLRLLVFLFFQEEINGRLRQESIYL